MLYLSGAPLWSFPKLGFSARGILRYPFWGVFSELNNFCCNVSLTPSWFNETDFFLTTQKPNKLYSDILAIKLFLCVYECTRETTRDTGSVFRTHHLPPKEGLPSGIGQLRVRKWSSTSRNRKKVKYFRFWVIFSLLFELWNIQGFPPDFPTTVDV